MLSKIALRKLVKYVLVTVRVWKVLLITLAIAVKADVQGRAFVAVDLRSRFPLKKFTQSSPVNYYGTCYS